MAGAAQLLDCHPKHVWRLIRNDPKFPRPIKLAPRHVVIDEDELHEYVAAKREAAA